MSRGTIVGVVGESQRQHLLQEFAQFVARLKICHHHQVLSCLDYEPVFDLPDTSAARVDDLTDMPDAFAPEALTERQTAYYCFAFCDHTECCHHAGRFRASPD